MRKRALLYVVIGWLILTLVEYYLLPYFIMTLVWVGLLLTLFVILIIETIKLVSERKSLTKFRILKVSVFSILFYFTFEPWIVHGLIEKVDWKMFYNKRMNIVEEVKNGKLYPNGKLNNGVCQLPFEFPALSNGGNDIVIYQNKGTNTWTVTFWVFRNYFEAPSTQFIYTNDDTEIKELERQVSNDPKHNWKLEANWYRTFGDE